MIKVDHTNGYKGILHGQSGMTIYSPDGEIPVRGEQTIKLSVFLLHPRKSRILIWAGLMMVWCGLHYGLLRHIDASPVDVCEWIVFAAITLYSFWTLFICIGICPVVNPMLHATDPQTRGLLAGMINAGTRINAGAIFCAPARWTEFVGVILSSVIICSVMSFVSYDFVRYWVVVLSWALVGLISIIYVIKIWAARFGKYAH